MSSNVTTTTSGSVTVIDNIIFWEGSNIDNLYKYDKYSMPKILRRLAKSTPEQRAQAIESAIVTMHEFAKSEADLAPFEDMKILSHYIDIYPSNLTAATSVGEAMLQITDLARLGAAGWNCADVLLSSNPENPGLVDETKITLNVKPSADIHDVATQVAGVFFTLKTSGFLGLMTVNYPSMNREQTKHLRLAKPDIKRYRIGPKKTTILSIRRPVVTNPGSTTRVRNTTKHLFTLSN